MYQKRFYASLLMVLVIITITIAAIPVAAQDEPQSKHLTAQQIRNIFIPSDGLGGGIQLVDGVAQEFAADSSDVVANYEVEDPIALGDINSDSLGDGVMVLSVAPVDGAGVFYSLNVIRNDDGQAHLVAFDVLGDRIRVLNLAVRNRQIYVDMIMRGENDPECCPTSTVRRVYEYKSTGAFDLISEVSFEEAGLPFAFDNELTHEELANLTYPETLERFSIDLVEGVYSIEHEEYTFTYQLLDDVVYGDLTGDELDEAVVFLQWNINDEPMMLHMYVIINDRGMPFVADWRDYSRSVDVEIINVAIENQVLAVDFRDVVHDREHQEQFVIEMEKLVGIEAD